MIWVGLQMEKKIIYTSKSFRDKTNYSTYHDTSFNYSETIWIMDADGTNKKQLTAPNRNWDSSPQWSPDGTKIVFQRMDVGTPFNIAVMNDDGSNLTILTTNGSIDISPQWSPKGDKIAFMSSKDGKFTISVIVLDEELASGPAAYVPDNIQKSPEKTPGFGSAIAIFMLFMLGKNMRKVN